jgi:hypothetical protein
MMTETLEELFSQYYIPSPQSEKQREIEEYHRQLIGALKSRKGKRCSASSTRKI